MGVMENTRSSVPSLARERKKYSFDSAQDKNNYKGEEKKREINVEPSSCSNKYRSW